MPLVIAEGAGSASRRAVGSPVFGGMIAAAVLGIFVIPMLYVVFQRMREWTVARTPESGPSRERQRAGIGGRQDFGGLIPGRWSDPRAPQPVGAGRQQDDRRDAEARPPDGPARYRRRRPGGNLPTRSGSRSIASPGGGRFG